MHTTDPEFVYHFLCTRNLWCTVLLLGVVSVLSQPAFGNHVYFQDFQWGTGGTGPGQFKLPRGIVMDPLGNFYVADSLNYRIQKFALSDDCRQGSLEVADNVCLIAKWGSKVSKGNGDGQFGSTGPTGLAIDPSGKYLYAVDSSNNRIQKFQLTSPCPAGAKEITSGVCFITKWGKLGTGNGEFDFPDGILTDELGDVYVADSRNHRVQKFSPEGLFIMKFDKNLKYPTSITMDTSGNIYVGNSNILSADNSIMKFDKDANFIKQLGSSGTGNGQFVWLQGLAVDPIGNLFAVDEELHNFQKFTTEGEFIGVTGGDKNKLTNPIGITIDSKGRIYVTDFDRVRVFSPSILAHAGKINLNLELAYPSVGPEPVTIAPKDIDVVAIGMLSTGEFNAPEDIDIKSLKIQIIGQQTKSEVCTVTAKDINGDGLKDLSCSFNIKQIGLQPGTYNLVVNGVTDDKRQVSGQKSLKIVQ